LTQHSVEKIPGSRNLMARTFASDMNPRKNAMMRTFGRVDEDARSSYGLRNQYEELIKCASDSGGNKEKDPVKWV
jgi:hypothetical protein